MDQRPLIDHIPALRRYARALTGDTWAADDLVQDTLERACSKWRLWLAGTDLRAWLFTLMHNLYVSEVRHRLRQGELARPVDLAELEQEPAAPASTADSAIDLQRCLLRLPQEQRAVLLLVTLEDLSYADVARIVGVPVGTVMSRLSRARARLQELLGDIAIPHPQNGGAISLVERQSMILRSRIGALEARMAEMIRLGEQRGRGQHARLDRGHVGRAARRDRSCHRPRCTVARSSRNAIKHCVYSQRWFGLDLEGEVGALERRLITLALAAGACSGDDGGVEQAPVLPVRAYERVGRGGRDNLVLVGNLAVGEVDGHPEPPRLGVDRVSGEDEGAGIGEQRPHARAAELEHAADQPQLRALPEELG